MLKIIVRGRSISWNDFHKSNSHWTRKAFTDQVHSQVHYALLEMGYKIQKPENYFKGKVDIQLNGYFRSSPIDSDNIPAKLYIDGLKSFILANDNIKHVGNVRTESFIDRDGIERVEIEITERREVTNT